MKNVVFGTLLFMLSFLPESFSQNGSYTQCNNTHFKNSKKISSSICFDKDDRWGQARAYDADGKIIYEKQLRKIGGHSTVRFSYHPNGAVSKAEWSSHPDGGIQWYKSVHEFSEKGELIHENEWSHDQKATFVSPPGYTPHTPTIEAPEKKEPVKAVPSEISISELWLVNNSGKRLKVISESLSDKSEKYTVFIAPGDTMKGGQIIRSGHFENPLLSYSVTIYRGRKKRRSAPVLLNQLTDPSRKELRKYYVELN